VNNVPRIMVIAPGHAFSTLDVFRGLCAGLTANGCEVLPFPLHDTLESMDLIIGAAKHVGIAPPRGYPDPVLLASAGIPGLVMARQPDWVIVIHGQNIPPTIPVTLQRGGYPTALLCTESPYQTAQFERDRAQHYAVVLTTERAAPALFTQNAPGTVHYLPHAYDPAVHTPDGPRAAPCDVFLCGTRYPERAALLDGVDWSGIAFRDMTLHYQSGETAPEVLAQVRANADVATHYRSARISLNAHRASVDFTSGATIAPGSAESLNPRAYEIPACGGFMLSDARAELADVFGASVPTYASSADLERLIRYYLAHEDERQALAAQQHAAVARHSWTRRAADLLTLLAAHAASVPLAA
jgi:spore maturation protein CgeB